MSVRTKQDIRRPPRKSSVAEPQPTRVELELPDEVAGRLEFPLLLACFFLSGLAALLYQTAWMRQFAVVFGTSELAIATVLSAYMAGLAAGSWLAGRLVHRVRRLVLTYAFLEFTIAAGALLVPAGLKLARWLMVTAIGGQPAPPDAGGWMQPAVYVASTFAILFLPTACMGATLPLLTKHAVRRSDQIGRRVGLLYAMNTFGAVVGTVVAGFLLLPHIGLFRTTLCGVGVNVAVFGVAVWLTRLGRTGNVRQDAGSQQLPREFRKTHGPHPADTPTGFPDVLPAISWRRGAGVLLPLMLLSGFVSFTYEVLWSRLLGHVIGGSTHAFATMLATFLTGIMLGSALASPLARSRRAGVLGFVLAQLGTAAFSVGLFWFLEAGIGWLTKGDRSQISPIWNAFTCSLVLLPSTICIGMTFPFAVRAMTDDAAAAGAVTGKVYAWNTIGGVLGALIAGFFIVPGLAFAGTVQLAVGMNLLLAALGIALLPRGAAANSDTGTAEAATAHRTRWPVGIIAASAAVAAALAYQPATPHGLLSTSSMAGDYAEDLVYLGVGRSSTVRVGQSPMFYVLTNNGLPEALVTPKGAPTLGMQLQKWLTALPLIARPNAESLLVIGFGGGGALEVVPDSVKEIDVLELEPLVLEANRQCAELRRFNPLADPRINVILNDARGALSLTGKKYDIIVSQPSHPWTAGASHLYTQEFMELVREHLTDDGVLLQWMNTSFLDDELFQTLGSTLLSTFPNVRLYQPIDSVLFFVASAGEIDLERQLQRTGEPLRSHPDVYAHMGVTGVSSLAATLRLDEAGVRRICEGTPPNTDDHNRLAFATSHNQARRTAADFADLLGKNDALMDRRSALYSPPDLVLDPAIIAARLHHGGFGKRGAEYQRSLSPAASHLVAGVFREREGNVGQANASFRQALAADPALTEAAYLLCELHAPAMARGEAEAFVSAAQSQLPEPEATVIKGAIALHRDDFATISRLEDVLAGVDPASSCYPMALSCRCAWRAAATRAPNRVQLAREAIVLADRALAVSSPRSESSLYRMRFNAAWMLGDRQAAIETALRIGMPMRGASEDDTATFLDDQVAEVVLGKLDRLQQDELTNQSRLTYVRELFDDLQNVAAQVANNSWDDVLPY